MFAVREGGSVFGCVVSGGAVARIIVEIRSVVVQIIAWVQQIVIPIWTSIHGIHRIQIVLRVQTVFFASFFIEPHFVAVNTFFGPIRYLINGVNQSLDTMGVKKLHKFQNLVSGGSQRISVQQLPQKRRELHSASLLGIRVIDHLRDEKGDDVWTLPLDHS